MLSSHINRAPSQQCRSLPQQCCYAFHLNPAHSQNRKRQYPNTPSRQHSLLLHAHNGEKAQQESTRPQVPATPPSKSSSSQANNPPQQQQPQQQQWSSIPVWLQERWRQFDLPQKAYTVVLGLVLLAALPKALMLLVLLLERVLIGGLLALEEVLLELLLKGGALLGALGALALLGAGVYVFARKAIK